MNDLLKEKSNWIELNIDGLTYCKNSRIKSESKKLMRANSPYTDDDVYDYLTDQICIFYMKNTDLIKHDHNPAIVC
jgi:hypothetical protein